MDDEFTKKLEQMDNQLQARMGNQRQPPPNQMAHKIYIVAAINQVLATPFYRVGSLLQTQAVNDTLKEKYTGVIDCCRRIVSEEGASKFFKGGLAAFLKAPSSLFLTTNLKTSFGHYNSSLQRFLGILAIENLVFVLHYPLEFTRIRYGAQVISKNKLDAMFFRGHIDCIQRIVKLEGAQGLYRGCLTGVIMRCVNDGIVKGIMALQTNRKLDINTRSNILLASVLMGFLASYPFQLISSQFAMTSGLKEKPYTGILDCMNKIYQKEGIFGFYRGFSIWASFWVFMVAVGKAKYFMTGKRRNP